MYDNNSHVYIVKYTKNSHAKFLLSVPGNGILALFSFKSWFLDWVVMFNKLMVRLVLGFFSLCIVVGCSPAAGEGSVDAADRQDFSGDLGVMQGSWESEPSKTLFSCEADVRDLRVQLYYRHVEEGPFTRGGCVFDRVDERRKCLVIDGVVEWSYKLEQLDGQDFLKLEFLCNDCKEWHGVHLHRRQDAREKLGSGGDGIK